MAATDLRPFVGRPLVAVIDEILRQAALADLRLLDAPPGDGIPRGGALYRWREVYRRIVARNPSLTGGLAQAMGIVRSGASHGVWAPPPSSLLYPIVQPAWWASFDAHTLTPVPVDRAVDPLFVGAESLLPDGMRVKIIREVEWRRSYLFLAKVRPFVEAITAGEIAISVVAGDGKRVLPTDLMAARHWSVERSGLDGQLVMPDQFGRKIAYRRLLILDGQKPRHAGGRPPKFDWEGAYKIIDDYLIKSGAPATGDGKTAMLVGMAWDYMAKDYEEPPVESSVKHHVNLRIQKYKDELGKGGN